MADRGVLLPHPQADYEVLEERLLEALELPLRRRARILECGHYLGPAKQLSLLGDDGAAASSSSPATDKAHWCRTCHCEIRYDSLGEGRVFRVKVYASNGLMRAGAWGACWKEMERVDVELEPIVDAALADELAALAAEQEQALETERHDASVTEYEDETGEHEAEQEPHEEPGEHEPLLERAQDPNREPLPLQLDEAPLSSAPVPDEACRALDDGDRLTCRRSPHSPGGGHPTETPPPSAQASPRRRDPQQAYKTASLPALVLEAARVLLRDKKNVTIALLGALVLALALGGTPVRGGAAP